MSKYAADLFPLTMSSAEAEYRVDRAKLDDIVHRFAGEISGANPTLLDAQAVIVATWEEVVQDARVFTPSK